MLKRMMILSAVVFLSACVGTRPRVSIPPSPNEIVATAATALQSSWGGDGTDRQMNDKPECKDYLAYSKKTTGRDDLINSKLRARCLQAELRQRLDRTESIEQATRIGLFMLGIGATAAGYFGASEDTIAGLALGAAGMTGLRGFQPIEPREVLYFHAMAALECSIMAAERTAKANQEQFTLDVLNALFGQSQSDNLASKKLMNPKDIYNKDTVGKSINEILYKRLRLHSYVYPLPTTGTCAAGAKTSQPIDGYINYFDVPDVASQYNKSGQCLEAEKADTLMNLATRIDQSLRGVAEPAGGIIGRDVLLTASRLTATNRRFVEAFMRAYMATKTAAEQAPVNLDNATTIVGMMVNKAIVEEVPDTSELIREARSAAQAFLNDVVASATEVKTFKNELEASKGAVEEVQDQMSVGVQELMPKIAAVKEAAGADAPDAAAEAHKVKEDADHFVEAVQEINFTRAMIQNVVSLLDDYKKYPSACKALLDGTAFTEQTGTE